MDKITYPIDPGYMGLDGKYHHNDGSLWTEEELKMQSEAISLKYKQLHTLTTTIKVSDFDELKSSWNFLGSKWLNRESEISAWWLIEIRKEQGVF